MNDTADIYHEIFQEKQTSISNNLHLDPGQKQNDTIKRLLDAGVINDAVRTALIGLRVNSRGARVIEHVIAVNNLDVYETFLAIWRDVNEASALEFEKLLNQRLEGYSKTRHIVVAHSQVQLAQHTFDIVADTNGDWLITYCLCPVRVSCLLVSSGIASYVSSMENLVT